MVKVGTVGCGKSRRNEANGSDCRSAVTDCKKAVSTSLHHNQTELVSENRKPIDYVMLQRCGLVVIVLAHFIAAS